MVWSSYYHDDLKDSGENTLKSEYVVVMKVDEGTMGLILETFICWVVGLLHFYFSRVEHL
jgi:hypothetical protein